MSQENGRFGGDEIYIVALLMCRCPAIRLNAKAPLQEAAVDEVAENENRDKSPIYYAPNIGVYTR